MRTDPWWWTEVYFTQIRLVDLPRRIRGRSAPGQGRGRVGRGRAGTDLWADLSRRILFDGSLSWIRPHGSAQRSACPKGWGRGKRGRAGTDLSPDPRGRIHGGGLKSISHISVSWIRPRGSGERSGSGEGWGRPLRGPAGTDLSPDPSKRIHGGGLRKRIRTRGSGERSALPKGQAQAPRPSPDPDLSPDLSPDP